MQYNSFRRRFQWRGGNFTENLRKAVRRLKRLILVLALLPLILTACAPTPSDAEAEPRTVSVFAMDCYITLTAYDGADDALSLASQELSSLEELWSVTLDASEVATLNREKSLTVSPETLELLTTARRVAELSDGAFDVTIYPLVRAWGFTTGENRIPSATELAQLQALVGIDGITVTENLVQLDSATELDLGAIAKGAAGNRVCELLREYGVTSALVSLGGNVQVVGAKPDGTPWSIAIADPQSPEAYLGVLQLINKAAVTSGGYQRYFERDGVRYHHILDPTTGAPASSGLLSATIIADDGTLADALSTAAFVLGLDGAAALWRSGELDFEMVLTDTDGTLHITKNLAETFTPLDESRRVVVIT